MAAVVAAMMAMVRAIPTGTVMPDFTVVVGSCAKMTSSLIDAALPGSF